MLSTEMYRFEPYKKWDEYHWKKMMEKKNEKPQYMKDQNKMLDDKKGNTRIIAKMMEYNKKRLNANRKKKKEEWDEKQRGNEMWD